MWKPVVGFEGLYEVSDTGEVKSLPRPRTQGIILSKFEDNGRWRVVLYKNGVRHRTYVYKLVAAAFLVGDGMVCHKDDNPLNDELSNLYYGTKASNTADAIANGKMVRLSSGRFQGV